jgi:hypothetical protein
MFNKLKKNYKPVSAPSSLECASEVEEDNERLWLILFSESFTVNRQSRFCASYYYRRYSDNNIPVIHIEIPPAMYEHTKRVCSCRRYTRTTIRGDRREKELKRNKGTHKSKAREQNPLAHV